MKILLLSDLPPCTNYSGGIFLEKLCSFLTPGSVAGFIVQNRYLTPNPSERLSWLPLQTVIKPLENPGLKKFGWIRSLLTETYNRSSVLPKIAKQAAEYGRSIGADIIWAPIQGQTMIHLANLVADQLEKPLYPLVYDPPGWWLRENNVQRWITKQVLSDFGNALTRSKKTACCSWAMSEYYHELYNANTIPVVAGLDVELARESATRPHDRSEFVICLAGQIYSSTEWNTLISALRSVNWTVGGKAIKLQLLANQTTFYADSKPMNIEFLGWRTQAETIQIFSEADLLYCPYWFDPAFELESRLSFPSKLTSYLASGRPVFFHGPEYASPAQFLKNFDAAISCHSLSVEEILGALERIITDVDLYEAIASNGNQAFYHHLTIDCMKNSFLQFIDHG